MHKIPDGLHEGGQALWSAVTAENVALDAGQLVSLEGACRMRDRADALAGSAVDLEPSALRHERESLTSMVRFLAAMRLPDADGRPMRRQVRGVQRPSRTSRDRLKAV